MNAKELKNKLLILEDRDIDIVIETNFAHHICRTKIKDIHVATETNNCGRKIPILVISTTGLSIK